MNATEVNALVSHSATRFGHQNPQQFKQLLSRLSKLPAHVVAHGLINVFTAGAFPPAGSPTQELAGRLLAELSPVAEFELKPVLRASLARYELSVEQYPLYLAALFGRESVLTALQQLEAESLSPQERRSLNTLRFWLKGSIAQQAAPA